MPATYMKFVSGKPLMVDHTPGAAVAAGDVVTTSATARIAHLDIPAGSLGSLAQGGGVYDGPKAAGASTAIGDNVLVYWDNTAKVVTATSTGNKRLGYSAGASLDADTTQRFAHSPG